LISQGINNMKFVLIWLFVFKKSLSKVSNTVSKVAIFSTSGRPSEETEGILYCTKEIV